MKFLICADLHGSAREAERLKENFIKEKADYIILLGDVYNHGPRNSLPERYAPMEVAQILNGLKDKLIVIKGNCDSEVDRMISGFDFLESGLVVSGDKTVFLTHGHVYNKDKPFKTKTDCTVYGHFHTGFIEKKDGVTYCNTGSLSIPKNGTEKSYVILEDGKLYLKSVEGKILASENI